jgi:hypothetical protein
MNRDRAVSFVAGFVCGVAALLLGLALTHNVQRPSQSGPASCV